MKKMLFTGSSILCAALLACTSLNCTAKDTDLHKIRCTCYIEPGVTRSGHYTHEGVIAGRKEDLGKIAALYAIDEDGEVGDFIGYFDFYDTGAGIDTDGDGKGDSIKRGKSVDVYKNDMPGVKEWIQTYGDYVYIKIIEAEG